MPSTSACKRLNARRGASNFTPEDLPRLVADAHARNVRIYLTLNIDITQRELGQAVRMLELASDAGVDAVLVRDPAVIGLRRSSRSSSSTSARRPAWPTAPMCGGR